MDRVTGKSIPFVPGVGQPLLCVVVFVGGVTLTPFTPTIVPWVLQLMLALLAFSLGMTWMPLISPWLPVVLLVFGEHDGAGVLSHK